ncbi:N-6 DNA methylase [uncultured Polaribacter sp.]|uniref:Eco57I restriction-modification methylase domain-containing protein n=1 Tax=uncultured Polaribacter sp. TaxID=174711 RepID=UPI0026147248|nr:N-6 DNA methylase [uncultured Polaribacter sp.]
MSLFQTSVLKNTLELQEKLQVEKAYKKYAKYFLNPTIQENIRNSKEEEYQGIFLTELFVYILEYTLKPNVNFNLVAEYKNQNNARKADGAILHKDIAIAVIELKGTKTKDLESIRKQAFDYKANQKGCVYVITSNFEKLRFYINDATEFEEFNLFELSPERFELFYLCLQKDNIINNVPLKIKEASIVQEEQITKDFYKDYSLFKRELYRDLVKQNAKRLKSTNVNSSTVERSQEEITEQQRLEKNVKLALFKKSQKLIDRFLFIFFAEDRSLLPANSTELILEKWKADNDFGDERPLYNLFKQYFNFLDKGRQGTKSRGEIYAYNGGLFKEDSLLDSLIIDNDLLYKYTHKLASYDFESQVDVNILGHIFENSLNEIESVNAEIEGADFDKQKSKRKKDGVFYTPKYITKYIVENTVGKLCTEKKAELGIKEEEYFKGRKNRQKATITKLVTLLDTYRAWLLQITICDPACGSGAFLNQALDFLIKEHNYIDELKTKVLGGGLQFSDIENTILENNIFGVDLNEESVEIAKLSLWLRTAQPRRKLNDLSSNIKCGNSLIDSKAIAGDKAFHWEKEFPNVFKEKNSKIYHLTSTIHDSRTSVRMETYKVRETREKGTNPKPNVVYFTTDDDLLITKTIAELVKKENLTLLAYNICADHIHLIIRCEEEEISKIMQKIKGVTSFIHNKQNTVSPKYFSALKENEPQETKTRDSSPLDKKKPLWSQKYYCKEITTKQQLNTTISYVKSNRSKHKLPEHSQEIKDIISSFCTTIDVAFKTEYKGGFDVVIGNPPYVQLQKMKNISFELAKIGYKTYESTGDLYCLFYEKGNDILKSKGVLGFITSNKWMRANYGKSLRKYLFENTNPYKLLDLGAGIFESAVVDSNIIMFEKLKVESLIISSIDISNESDVKDLVSFDNYFVDISPKNDDVWTISSKKEQALKDKVLRKGKLLKDWNININRGILTGLTEAFIINEEKKNEFISKDVNSEKIIEPILRGRDVDRYQIDYQDLYLLNVHNGFKETPKIEIEDYPIIKEHLEQYEPKLSKRYDKGSTPFNLRNCAYLDSFLEKKIIWKEMSSKPPFVLDVNKYFTNDTITFITGDDLEYLLAMLNSKLMFYIFSNYYSGGGLGSKGIRFKKDFLSNLPITEANNKTQFIEKVESIISKNNVFQNKTSNFQTYLKQKFSLEKLSKKLQNWHELDFGDFIKELNKAIKAQISKGLQSLAPLTKKDEFEWLELFEENKQKAQELQTQINQTDAAIDAMVYKLYGLTEDEIKIVETS